MTTAKPEGDRRRRRGPAPDQPIAAARPPERPGPHRSRADRRAARRPRPAADLLLPAAGRLRAAADHRPDHGAERLQRLHLPYDDDSYAIVKRQLLWVVIGLPCAFVASRLPHRWVRAAGLARLSRLADAAAAHRVLRRRASTATRTGWPSARSPIQPSEIAKLALVLWAAHVYARKERRLGSLHHVMIPVVPGMLLATGLVVARRRPRHGPGAVRDPAGDALGGRRAAPGCSSSALDRRRRPALSWPRRTPSGSPGSPTSPTRSRTTTTPAGSPPTASTPCRPAAASARASAPASRSGATCPRHTPTSSSRCSARSSGWPARCWSRPLPHHRLRRAADRACTPRTPSSATCPSASWSGCSAR